MVEWKSYAHPRLRIPVYSLYAEHREPTLKMLQDFDVLLVDLQDIGARYYTFIWTMYLCMRACEQAGVAIVVLDRPNPINGLTTEGPMLDANYKSFVGMHPLPVRHGRSIGELAQQFRDEAFPPNRPAMGYAVTQYGSTRHGDRLPRYVSARGHKHFRGTRHDPAV